MDNLTKVQRSYNMSRIKSSGTKLEEKFFKLLEENNILHIKHPKILGKPDCQIGNKLLVFVDSDFWHGWNFNRWKNRLPKEYWSGKIEKNIKRDKYKFRVLKKQGYKVLRIWGHSLTSPEKVLHEIRSVMIIKNT